MSKEFTDQTSQDQKAGEAGGSDASGGDKPFLEVDGRVFQTQEDVIKNIVNAQSHISKLESEAAARAQQGAESKAEEERSLARQILDGIKEEQNRKDDNTSQSSKVELNEEDIVKKVMQSMERKTAEQTAEQRNDQCHALAQKELGDGYEEAIAKKAKALNMSMSEVNTLARTSVEAFSELFLPKTDGGNTSNSFSSDADSTGRQVESLLSGGSKDNSDKLASFKGKSDKARVAMVTDLAAEYGITYGKQK
jgi:flagellar biosynthesis GTPase FlhF